MNTQDYDAFINMTLINQPLINVGMIGHVANGKSTITRDISKENTQRHSKEIKNNLTIKLGYANAKIFKCSKCSPPECFQSTKSSTIQMSCQHCKNDMNLLSHVSFADCPGHALFMSTMLNGTCIMNYAILVESITNETIPAPQTIEHLKIAKEAGIDIRFVCLNKIDLMIKKKEYINNAIDKLKNFMLEQGYNVPIVPISGTLECNIDVICEYISRFPIPQKILSRDYKMFIVRSFNVNKEKTNIINLQGGVIGGSIVEGIIKINDEICIYPGYTYKKNDKWVCNPLKSRIVSIKTGDVELDHAIPGGLIGMQLDIDPSFTQDDKLIGNVIYPAKNVWVSVYDEIRISYKKIGKCDITINDLIQINANSNNVKCTLNDIDDINMTLKLENPVCLEHGDTISINKISVNHQIEIYGYGNLIGGMQIN